MPRPKKFKREVVKDRPQIKLSFHPIQYEAFTSSATEILYGGAAGGGKSAFLRMLAAYLGLTINKLQIYLFRRLLPDLQKTHLEGPGGFKEMLAPLLPDGYVHITENEIRFNETGSKIYLCHCQEEDDINKYLSTDIHVLLIDEASQFTEKMYRFLRSRLRLAGVDLSEADKDRFPRVILASNPGGVGHNWLKRGFIDGAVPKSIRQMPRSEGNMRRQYIPARLKDNPSLNYDLYSGQLEGLGSPDLVKAYLDGDWNVVTGSFFPEFGNKHIINAFTIPPHWTRFQSYDHGYHDPFSIGWWAVVSGDYNLDEETVLPAGALVRYKEWYGADQKGAGLKLSTYEIAEGIKAREGLYENISYRVAGVDLFSKRGQDSNAERLGSYGLYFQKAATDRLAGWGALRDRLKGRDGVPGIYIINTCTDFIEQFPNLMHSRTNPEDAQERGADIQDETRYAVMSRPFEGSDSPVVPQKDLTKVQTYTLNDLYDLRDRERGYA